MINGGHTPEEEERKEKGAFYDPCAFYVLMCVNQRTRTTEAVVLTQAAKRHHWSSLENPCFCALCKIQAWHCRDMGEVCICIHVCMDAPVCICGEKPPTVSQPLFVYLPLCLLWTQPLQNTDSASSFSAQGS